MKRFLTCALCFVSLPAIAATLYYEQGGMCSGLYRSPGCNGTQVTHLSVTPSADTTFTGFKVNGQTIVDANGNVAANASEILRNAGNVGSKIPQSYDCKSGFSKNNNGICVDPSGNTTYIDFENGNEDDGYEISYNEVGGRGGVAGSNECVHSKFKVKIHWCPPKYGAYTNPNWTAYSGWNPYANPVVPAGFDYPELWPSICENGVDITEDLDYEWNRATCGVGNSGCAKYKKLDGSIKYQLNVPTGFDGWTLRGFYLLEDDLYDVPSGCNESTNASYYNPTCYDYWGKRNYFAKRRVVTKTNTEGTARLGLPKPNTNTETGYIDLDDSHTGANGPWSNTRWTVYDCSIDHTQAEQKTYHLYAGWARTPEYKDDDVDGRFKIYRTGLQNPNKGDAEYVWWCKYNTETIHNANAYNPYCTSNACSLEYLSLCNQQDCLNLQGTNWCAGTPQCVLGASAQRCCVGSLGNCTTAKDCVSVGGIWDGTTCSDGNPGGGDTCTFGGRCTITACNNMGGVCANVSGTECTCNQPSSDEPEWVSVEFRYGNVTLTSPASPTTFYLDKKRKCYYAYTQPVSKDNCGLNSPYRLQYITIPTAQGKTFAGFWREGQSLKIIDTDGKVRATNQGIGQLTFNSSATATVMYLTAHWN